MIDIKIISSTISDLEDKLLSLHKDIASIYHTINILKRLIPEQDYKESPTGRDFFKGKELKKIVLDILRGNEQLKPKEIRAIIKDTYGAEVLIGSRLVNALNSLRKDGMIERMQLAKSKTMVAYKLIHKD